MEDKDINIKAESPRRFVWTKWFKRLFIFIFLVITLLIVLLKSETVQNYLLNTLTKSISEKTNTKISAQEITFSFFDGLGLQGLSVVDNTSNDTIIYGGKLNISLRKNLLSLLNNKLDLSYIGLKDIKLNIITEIGSYSSNLDKFLANLSSKEGDSSKPGLEIDFKSIDLSNIDIFIHDKNQGKYLKFFLQSGSIEINQIDLACNEIDIESIILDRPIFHQQIYGENCKITDDLNITLENNAGFRQPLVGVLRELIIKDGSVGFFNSQKVPLKTYLDYNNFSFDEIDLLVKNVELTDGFSIEGRLEMLNAKDNTGFKIKNIAIDTFLLNKEMIELKSFVISAGNTQVRDYLMLSFEDWSAFSNFGYDVYINADLRNTQVYLGDIAHFVQGLYKSNFVNQNAKELITVNGKYAGFINNIGGRDVEIKMSDRLYLTGIFNTRDLLDSDNTLLNVRLDNFKTSMRRIKQIFPQFRPPENFFKLGNINFRGRFDGFLEDFVAFGTLNSDLGSASMDMSLNIRNGIEKSKYSGNIDLKNFNLKAWSDNDDLGKISVSAKVTEGIGLTLNSVKANLTAVVSNFGFKNYNYQNVTLKGNLDKNTFDGQLTSQDKNFDLAFNGNFEYFPDNSFLNFDADIKNIDLKALNFSKDSTLISGNIQTNVSGTNLNDFIGDIVMDSIQVYFKNEYYVLDQLLLSSKINTEKEKVFLFKGDLGEASIIGQYDLNNLLPSLKRVMYSNHKEVYKLINDEIVTSGANQRFDFNLDLGHSKNFLGLLGLKNAYFTKMQLKGRIDTYKNDFSLAADFPSLYISENYFRRLNLLVNTNNGLGDIIVSVDSTHAIGRPFNPIDFQAKIKGDTVTFDISTERLSAALDEIAIKGDLTPHPKGYRFSIYEKRLILLGSSWKIQSNNSLVFGKNYINFSNFYITDGTSRVEFNDTNNNKGVNIGLSNLDLSVINKLVNVNQLQFNGASSISLNIPDIFDKNPSVSGYINVPQFYINKMPYGSIFIDVDYVKDNLKMNASIGDFIALKGTYHLQTKELDSKVRLRKAPLKIVEYFLKEGIKDTDGFVYGDIMVSGNQSGVTMNGEGEVRLGRTTVIYTGATYTFDKQKFTMTEKIIDLTGVELKDINGNIGSVQGRLTHNFFAKFGVNATISGNNIVALNTTKADNPDYYGYCVGDITASFNGLFEKLNMDITGVTRAGSKLSIPVNNSQKAIEASFIKFKTKEDKSKPKSSDNSLKGINLQMALTITPDAEMNIIFDESRGDVIRGRGRGNIKVEITRNGDFEIFGGYDIESGEYLFTAPILLLAKPFIIERGGRVQWTGDPVNATLDITAKYRTRTNSLRNFVSEYLVDIVTDDPQLRESVDVEVNLNLGGFLFSPEISFGLNFPNLIGEAANIVENKLRLLQNNPQEINSQVLGLIVFNSFMPSSNVGGVFGTSGIQSASINTLSEFLASQLSLYITNVLNTIVSDDSFISSIDFGLNVRNNNFGVPNVDFVPDEVGIRNTIYFKNNRLSIDLGGQYVYQFLGQSINQVLPDFALEFVLTEDRKMRIRLYGKTDLDILNGNLRQKYGLGIGYRTEFGSVLDFENALKQSVQEVINNN